MKKDARVYLDDVLECIQKIEEYTRDLDFDAFDSKPAMQDAVIRRLEIIGEAVKNLPDEYRTQYGMIPWKQIAGMRDVLIHEYAGVSIHRVWEVVTRDLPALKKVIGEMLNKST